VEHEIGALFGGAGLLAFSVTVRLAAKPLGSWAIAAGVAAWAAAALGTYFVVHGPRAGPTFGLRALPRG
jgi:hypothetical protein